ncbi:MAG: hypothetical protein JWQ77_2584 [Jatrophihabitans sp.]|nr:hypothetical protein [Jatrophihabitans sp.]
MLAAVCVAAAATAGAAQFDPTLSARKAAAQARQPAATAAKIATAGRAAKKSSGYPPLPAGYQRQGLRATGSQDVKRAEVRVDIPRVSVLADLHLAVRPQPNPLVWADTTGRLYIGSPKGSAQPFGEFPAIHVAALGFGLLPVTAIVHITQLRSHGQLVPLSLNWAFTNSADTANGNWYYAEQPHLTGNVDIRISDVEVDKQSVDVGADCHTATPATMALTAPSGRYKAGLREPRTIYLPYNTDLPNVLRGTVDIPAFTSCVGSGGDVSSLLTTMVSGAGNPIAITQKGAVGNYIPPKH